MSSFLVNKVSHSYDGIILFDNLQLNLAHGKWTCLLGPSGAGKTTLLRIIAGLIPNDLGPHPSPEISYMAQTDLLLPWLTAMDNVLIGTKLRGNITKTHLHKARDLFSKVGLNGAENKFPSQLSGGMRQRVALVRTLMEEKNIVLMDEPFSGVDAITRYQLQTLAAELLKDCTVLLVTHDPLEAIRLGDEIFVLSGVPAVLQLAAKLSSPIPRDPADSDVVKKQADLFHLLTQAKGELT